MTTGAGVHLADLSRSYGGIAALDGLDLLVEPGEFVSLLGPSGCGKTTALRILAGLETADTGRVLVGGEDITRTPANRRDMGMVFQAYSLFPNLSARDNVGFGVRLRKFGKEQERQRADELLELVGLSDQAGKYPHQMSGGQQQRVALARALAIRPRVLLLDEPLSALDAQVRVQLREEIRRIQTDLAITTLFVTHDQEEALAVSDRVGVMSRGRLEQLGSPADVYQRPATPFVAEFLGVNNAFAGTVEGSAVRLADGTRLPAAVVGGLPDGSAAKVLLRPGDVRVRPGNAASDGELAGIVLTHGFLGPLTRVSVRSGSGAVVRVDVPSSVASATPPGAAVVLSADPAAALLGTGPG